MFDDLRQDSQSSAYFQAPPPEEEKTDTTPALQTRAALRRPKKSARKLPRLTPAQRLVLALLLLGLVCVAGLMFLLLTGKIVPL